DALWDLFVRGHDAIMEVPPQRWDADSLFDPEPGTPDKTYSRWGAFLDEIEMFDPDFFGMSRPDAARLDPQQRLLLELAWEAIDSAGLVRERLAGSSSGVFFGIMSNDYFDLQHAGTPSCDPSAAIGTQLSMAAGR